MVFAPATRLSSLPIAQYLWGEVNALLREFAALRILE
jgi:hypothetical protein